MTQKLVVAVFDEDGKIVGYKPLGEAFPGNIDLGSDSELTIEQQNSDTRRALRDLFDLLRSDNIQP